MIDNLKEKKEILFTVLKGSIRNCEGLWDESGYQVECIVEEDGEADCLRMIAYPLDWQYNEKLFQNIDIYELRVEAFPNCKFGFFYNAEEGSLHLGWYPKDKDTEYYALDILQTKKEVDVQNIYTTVMQD